MTERINWGKEFDKLSKAQEYDFSCYNSVKRDLKAYWHEQGGSPFDDFSKQMFGTFAKTCLVWQFRQIGYKEKWPRSFTAEEFPNFDEVKQEILRGGLSNEQTGTTTSKA